MNDAEQPDELTDVLADAEAIVTEWYSRDGLEGAHERNIGAMAQLMALQVVMLQMDTFEAMTQAARLYLVAAFQMGRAAYDASSDCG